MVTLPFPLVHYWFSGILNWSYTEVSDLGNIFSQHFLIFTLKRFQFFEIHKFSCVWGCIVKNFDQTFKILSIWTTMYKTTIDWNVTTVKVYWKNWKSYNILTPVFPNHFFLVSKSWEICFSSMLTCNKKMFCKIFWYFKQQETVFTNNL